MVKKKNTTALNYINIQLTIYVCLRASFLEQSENVSEQPAALNDSGTFLPASYIVHIYQRPGLYTTQQYLNHENISIELYLPPTIL